MYHDAFDFRRVAAELGIVYVKVVGRFIFQHALDQRLKMLTVDDIRIDNPP